MVLHNVFVKYCDMVQILIYGRVEVFLSSSMERVLSAKHWISFLFLSFFLPFLLLFSDNTKHLNNAAGLSGSMFPGQVRNKNLQDTNLKWN